MLRLLCRLGHHRWKGQGLQRPFGWLYVCVRCRQVARWEQETPTPAPEHGPEGNEGYCCCGEFVGHGDHRWRQHREYVALGLHAPAPEADR